MSDNVNPISLYEVVISVTNDDASSYETPIDLYKDQVFTISSVHDTDEQRDSGEITDGLSIATHGEFTIQSGGIPFEALIAITGASSSTSGAVVTIDPATGENRPYFGAIGVAPASDGRYVAIGVMKCQLENDPEFSLNGEANEFNTTEMSGRCFARSAVSQFMRAKIYDALSDWEADKPSDAAEFLAWFPSAT